MKSKLILLIVVLMLNGCASGSDTLHGFRGIEHPDSTFHRGATEMMVAKRNQ